MKCKIPELIVFLENKQNIYLWIYTILYVT